MTDLVPTEELRAHLIANGIGIDYADVHPYTLGDTVPADPQPSVWPETHDGDALPRYNKARQLVEPATITVRSILAARPNDEDYYAEESYVEVVVRSATSAYGVILQRHIRDLLIPTNVGPGGAKQVMIRDLLCEYIRQWNGDAPIPTAQATAEESRRVFTRRQSFAMSARRKALAGMPYVP